MQKKYNKGGKAASNGSKLPYLKITDVIDTSGFASVGKELVGTHPIFGSTTGTNLKVNPELNVWSCFHAGNECGGDAWLWLACECGAIEWHESKKGALRNPKSIQKTKEHAISRGLLSKDALFPEHKEPKDAVEYCGGDKEEKPSPATQIVEMILAEVDSGDVELWHTPKGEAQISMRRDDHLENRMLNNRDTQDYFASLFYLTTGKVASSSSLRDAIGTLNGIAQSGPEYSSFIRVGESNGKIYLDLGNTTWNAVEVSAQGWRIVRDPPIKFMRPPGMLALPEPVSGGSLDDLRPYVNAENDEHWTLMKAWEIGLLKPKGPYPIPCVFG